MAAMGYARQQWRTWLIVSALVVLAFALRLLVWRWREFYDLGGDEREYLEQAVKLLQTRQYVELRLMRPPLYTLFLAGSIQIVDSLIQHLRLVQAVLSALTIIPLWLLAHEIASERRTAVASVACLLVALNYTLAANATELLSETLFVLGLTTLFWLLLRAARFGRAGAPASWRWAAVAGLSVGLLCLVRSVAQPLIPLAALWLLVQIPEIRHGWTLRRWNIRCACWFVGCALLVIVPWTVRNYVTYGAVILIDTTGAENLWLDNNPTARTAADPLGREDAKRQLYALGDDRAARQRLASQRGAAAIIANPGWFAAKASGELLKFFALEYTDDMRARPVIWHPPAEIWLRLILGDGLWLLVLLGGIVGLVLVAPATNRQTTFGARFLTFVADARFLFVPWLLYILLTALLFHVELRYRLPVYPVLIVYAALVLVAPQQLVWRPLRIAIALASVATCLVVTVLHAPYPALAWQLGWKHYDLWQSERALAAGNMIQAETFARAAATRDPESALAQVALARAALLRADRESAVAALDRAIDFKAQHPYAHLLLGDLQRADGQDAAAERELAFETGSLEDLQRWSWARFASPPAARLDVGNGLDLGFVAGCYSAEQGGWRWTTAQAQLRLHVPAGSAVVRLRLASGRPHNVVAPFVRVLVGGKNVGTVQVDQDWAVYSVPLPDGVQGADAVVELASDTFAPRAADPTSNDGRTLGVMLDWAEVGR